MSPTTPCNPGQAMANTSRVWLWGLANILSCLATTAAAAAGPAIEVDISGLPASEQAALVPIIRAARQMDGLYLRHDFYPPGTTKHDIDLWLGTLSEPERRQALDPFTV